MLTRGRGRDLFHGHGTAHSLFPMYDGLPLDGQGHGNGHGHSAPPTPAPTARRQSTARLAPLATMCDSLCPPLASAQASGSGSAEARAQSTINEPDNVGWG